MAAMAVDAQLAALQARFTDAGQGHVFRYVAQLDAEQKQQFLSQLMEINLDDLARMHTAIENANKIAEEKIAPFLGTTDAQRASMADRERWRNRGLELISKNQVALLLLGGGQGTRLGFDKPKGQYDVGLPSHKSLFQLHAERLRRMKFLAARQFGVEEVSIPWFIMTSPFTHEETISYFKDHQYFGLPPADVFFFSQSTLPCLTAQGKIILETGWRVASAPNGNGGVYQALDRSGALRNMETRGIRFVHCYSVDNILAKVVEPTFIGFCDTINADCANKVVRKDDPAERVGCMCLRNGKPAVIEYSEIPKEMAERRDAKTGLLEFGAANIVNHLFSFKFLVRMAQTPLPYHLAFKKIPYSTDDGRSSVEPQANNGYKLEMFVFDVFAFADNMVAFSTAREGDFSPVKNAPGAGVKDSPVTARHDLSSYHIKLVNNAGGNVEPSNNSEALFEISPLVSYDGEDLEKLVQGKTFRLPYELK